MARRAAIIHTSNPKRSRIMIGTKTLSAAAIAFSLISSAPSLAACSDCGVVAGVRVVEKEGKASGVGAVAGGVGGALLGSQLGKGNGKTALTVAGAAGGAYAGHQVEKSMKKTKSWEVSVKLEGGSTRNFSYAAEPGFRAGDKVRIRDGKLTRADN
jgi:outer membrane lipoprotein SlyB